MALGGGRRVETDRIDPAVGLTDVVSLGQPISRGDPLATVHAADEDTAIAAAEAVRAAITVGAAADVPPLIHEEVS